jgi:hypothetical protein
MTTVAYYTALDNTNGIALRTAAGTVHFQVASTGLWRDLTDADAPRLTLYGRVDLADAQQLLDGDRVRTCSKTLVGGVR